MSSPLGHSSNISSHSTSPSKSVFFRYVKLRVTRSYFLLSIVCLYVLSACKVFVSQVRTIKGRAMKIRQCPLSFLSIVYKYSVRFSPSHKSFICLVASELSFTNFVLVVQSARLCQCQYFTVKISNKSISANPSRSNQASVLCLFTLLLLFV